MTPALQPQAFSATDLDRLLEASWRQAGVSPAPAADDGAYLRRVTLDLAGRVPTLEEARAFVADPAADKRTRLVDRLLSSADHAEHFADLYSGPLFGDERKIEKLDPRDWLVRAFAENRPYDQIARELISASGDLRDNGALAFFVTRAKGGGGPEAVTAGAARMFLGLQIQCAQCHDHPYDERWKQEDFYGLVAYFSRTRSRQEKPDRSMDMDMGARTYIVTDVKRGAARMRKPKSESEVKVEPRFLGRDVAPRADETLRQAFARAVIASDLFPKTMVARTWAHLFGRGLVDPWDDLGGENDPRHPELLTRLAQDFVAHGYDIRRLVRTIVLSTAYQRSSAPADDGGASIRAFARTGIRPLMPEQLVRSVVTATGVDQLGRRQRSDDAMERRLAQTVRQFRFFFEDDEMAQVNTFDGSVPQVLLLLNGDLTNQAVRAAPRSVLGQLLARQRDPEARIDDLFWLAYTRSPSADERSQLLTFLNRERHTREAYEDLLFALLTSTEAITNH